MDKLRGNEQQSPKADVSLPALSHVEGNAPSSDQVDSLLFGLICRQQSVKEISGKAKRFIR